MIPRFLACVLRRIIGPVTKMGTPRGVWDSLGHSKWDVPLRYTEEKVRRKIADHSSERGPGWSYVCAWGGN